MIDRNRGGIRTVGVKARLAVAAAVLVGGGAAGVVALAANHGGSAATTAVESAGYTRSFHHTMSEQAALTRALSPGMSSTASMTALADMAPMRTFSQVQSHHTTLAVQRGIVLLATKKFLVVKSANGAIHLWWLSGATRVKDVVSSATGMAAMTGSYPATNMAMSTGNMTPSVNVVAGSTGVVSQLTTPVAKPTTITINTGGEIITITVASSTAAVTQPMTTPQSVTTAPTTRTRQSAWWTMDGVKRGDLVLVAGTRTHGKLRAELVLFAAPRANMPTPSVSPTSTIRPSSSATPTAVPSPNTTISGQPVSIGTSS